MSSQSYRKAVNRDEQDRSVAAERRLEKHARVEEEGKRRGDGAYDDLKMSKLFLERQ